MAACAAAGHLAARYLIARDRRLAVWEEALLRMEGELRRGGAELPALLRRSAGESLPALAALADRLSADPAAAPEKLLAALPGEPLLQREEEAALRQCLTALFTPDLDRQRRALSMALEQWALFRGKAREAKDKNARLYRSLGWLSGAALMILLC